MTDGIKRRDFLKVLGVSGAGATMTGCGPGEVEKLLPTWFSPRRSPPVSRPGMRRRADAPAAAESGCGRGKDAR